MRQSKYDHSPIRPASRSATLASIVGGPVRRESRLNSEKDRRSATMVNPAVR